MTTETILTDEQIEECYSDKRYVFARAIEQAVLQSPEVQAWKRDAELYQKLRSICVTSTDFTGVMQPDELERWCVLRRKDGVISSFSCDDLDHGIRAAMEQQT